MDKKKLNILLIPLALTVWIIILIRVFAITSHPSDHHDSKAFSTMSLGNFISSDTLNLLLNYRDPFEPVNISLRIDNEKNKDKKQFSKPEDIKPPVIKYIGLIEKSNKGNNIGLTIINDHSFLFSKGDTIMGLRIKSVYQDSILLEFHTKILRISKTQQRKI